MKKLTINNKYIFIIVILMFVIFDVKAAFPTLIKNIEVVIPVGQKSTMSNRKCYNSNGARYTCPSGDGNGYEEWKSNYKKGVGNDGKTYVVICTNHNATSPAGDNVECQTKSISNATKAGVAAIINASGPFYLTSGNKCYWYRVGNENRYLADGPTGCVNEKYVQASITISKFLYEKGISSSPSNKGTAGGGCKGGCPSSWLTQANNAYNNVVTAQNAVTEKTFVSIENVTHTEDSNSFYLTVPITSNYTITDFSIKVGSKILHSSKSSDNKYTISKSDLNEGNNTITITVGANHTVIVAELYDCGSGYQTITPAYTEEREVANATATKTYTLTKNSKGQVKIKKVKPNGDPIINKDVGFKFYNSKASCISNVNSVLSKNSTTGGKGIISVDLSPGEYWVRESIAPDGYELSNECVYIGNVSAGQTMTDASAIKYENVATCVTEFKDNSSIQNRLQLYKTYDNFKNLLNFNITDASIACSAYTPNYNSSESCLSINKVSEATQNKFTNMNLSDYNDIITSNNKRSYCLTNFSLSSSPTVKIRNPVKAGQMVYGTSQISSPITGTITKTCYIHKNDISDYNIESNTLFSSTNLYTNNIGNILLDNQNLSPSINITNTTPHITVSSLIGEFYKVTATMSVSYNLNPIFVYKLSGKLEENGVYCGASNPKCVSVGYGVLSNFVEAKNLNRKGSFNFKVSPGSDSIFEFNGSGNICEYTVEPEIIKYNNNNGKLDLEFRTIDTNNPFGRVPKSNWNDGTNKGNSNNSIINEHILNATNSYGTKKGETEKQTPKYTIILTPDIIDDIRDYNKEMPYDDYDVCQDRVGCKKDNWFLNEYIKKGVIK